MRALTVVLFIAEAMALNPIVVRGNKMYDSVMQQPQPVITRHHPNDPKNPNHFV